MGLRIAILALALVAGPPAAAGAADWGGISPGTSTTETVRQRYGAPSRETRQRLEGYDTVQWVYEGARAPVGMKRMIVDFGLLAPGGYRPNLVRSFTLEPKPRIFDYVAVVRGWGIPDGVAEREGRKVYFYQRGLLVYFDQSGDETVSMVFSPPQPEPKPPAK